MQINSRSYFLAHKQAQGILTDEDKAKLPKDFDLVRKTYDAFGNVWGGLYEDWWSSNGEKLFSVVGRNAQVDVIHRLGNDTEIDGSLLQEKIATYKSEVLNKLENPETLFVALPLLGYKTELMEALSSLLDKYQDVPRPAASFELNNKLIRHEALKMYLDLLWAKLYEPELPMWVLAMRFKLTNDARALVKEGEARPGTADYTDINSEVGKIYRKARCISESAARGSFPTPLKLRLPKENKELSRELFDVIFDCNQAERDRLFELERTDEC